MQHPLTTAKAPALDPQARLLRALRSWDPDAAALFDLPAPAPRADIVPPWLPGLRARAAEVQGRDLPRAELAELLVRQAECRGAGAESLAAAERLADPETVAVLTGQQVGLFGGPALTLYKALGAVATARALSESGVPAVPVFWMATFDHDLDEVAHVEVVAGGHDRRRLRLRGGRRGPSVGGVGLGAGVDGLRRDFIDGLRGVPALAGGLERVDDLLAELYAESATFGGAFARLLGGLTDRLGLVLLDPCDSEFAGLAPARALLAREIEGRGGWSTQALAKSEAELARRGYDALVPERRGGRLGVFFADDEGRRVALIGGADGVRPIDGSWRLSWAEVAALAEQSPGRFTPDVLLRPLLQDACLPTVAYVGGPSELQYHAQLGALYAELGIPRPLPLCRPSFTLVDTADLELLRGLGSPSWGERGGAASEESQGSGERPGDGTTAPPERELAALGGLLRAPRGEARAELVAAAMSAAERSLVEALDNLQEDACTALAGRLRSGAFSGPRGLRAQVDVLQAQVEGLLGRLGPRVRAERAMPPGRAVRGSLRLLVEGVVADVSRALERQRAALTVAEDAGQIPSGRGLVRARKRLRWLRTQLRKRARRRASAAFAALARLRPQGRPQERALSLAQLAAWLGGRAADRLLPVSMPANSHTLVAIPRNNAPVCPVGEPAERMRSRTTQEGERTGGAPVAVPSRDPSSRAAGGGLRIGVVCLGGLGGSTKVAVEIAAGLADSGNDVHLFHGSKPEVLAAWLPDSQHGSITLHRLPLRSTPGPTLRSALDRASVRLREVCAAERLDCLHVHYAADLLGCSLRAVQTLDIPVVATLHGTDVTPWRRGAGPREMLAADLGRCAAVTAVSTWLSEQARTILKLDTSPSVVSNSVDSSIFKPQPDPDLRRRLVGGDDLLLVHVSNLRPVKRPGDAVRILAGLRAQGLKARLLIVGEGPRLGELGAEAAALGVDDAVDCVGRLDPDELARYLSVSDVALMPSESESFGLAALEAMACGTPVVGSRCGGLEEVVAAVDDAIRAGEETGLERRFVPLARLLSEIGDVAGMVEAIRGLAIVAERSPAEHRAFSDALVRGAGQAFPQGAQLSAYTAILGRAVTRRSDDDGVRAAG